MNRNRRKDHSTYLVIVLVLAIVLALVTAIVLVSLTYHQMVLGGQWAMSSEWLHQADVEARAAALGQLGDYFGGTLNPILSFSGFLVLLLTVLLQRRQLQEGTRQAEQSTRAIDLEAFVRVNDILQTAAGIAARRRLYELLQDGAGKKALAQWTPEDQAAAETVARQFELVGLLVEGRLFDPDLFLRSWHGTVQKCWAACAELAIERRSRQQDPALWRRFEELNALAGDCRPSIPARLGYEPMRPGVSAPKCSDGCAGQTMGSGSTRHDLDRFQPASR